MTDEDDTAALDLSIAFFSAVLMLFAFVAFQMARTPRPDPPATLAQPDTARPSDLAYQPDSARPTDLARQPDTARDANQWAQCGYSPAGAARTPCSSTW